MALLSQSDLEAKLNRTLTSSEVTMFNIQNVALQKYVEERIGSALETVSATTRYYDGGKQHLPIDPCTEVSLVQYIDVTRTVITDIPTLYYLVESLNKTLKTQLTYQYGCFVGGYSNIAVTAEFSIAGDVAAVAFVKDIMLNALALMIQNTTNIKMEDIEGYKVIYDRPDVKEALMGLSFLFPGMI